MWNIQLFLMLFAGLLMSFSLAKVAETTAVLSSTGYSVRDQIHSYI
jgi:hypothetical protein